MSIRGFDHVAIPIQNVEEMLAFYRALGFAVNGRGPRYSVHFGDQKINFHGPEVWQGGRFTLRGPTARPGCGDFCFVWDGGVQSLREMLSRAGARIIEGPVERMGGRGGGAQKGTSFYVRDPDANLLEFIVYPE
ncbi:MAG TPA: VOC family protein [candidate division Zixibacteria bacterium]|nr:VOC family protein [candidate division Zixibacteria bacterium]